MSHASESTDAIDSVAGHSAMHAGTRAVQLVLMATFSAVALGLIAPPVAGPAWTAATAGFAVALVRLRRLRRLRWALTGHPWRRIDLTRVGASAWWESIEYGSRQRYALPTHGSARVQVNVAGPDRPKRRSRQWSAMQAGGSEQVRIIRGPRSPNSWTVRAPGLLPGRARREIANRPAVMYDVPPTRCRLERAGLAVLRERGDPEPTELVVIMRAKRAATSCELWLNGGEHLGEVARDKTSLGLLDSDGHLVVESDQRFGLQLFSGAATFRLACGQGDALNLEGRVLRCRALHNGCQLESSGGAAVARAVQASRSRRERIVVTSIATTLSPIERAVVLLRVCTLLDLPALPAVST